VTAGPKGRRNETTTPDGVEPALPVRRRRVPGWLIALVGAAIGGGFGVGVERMMFGPPLVMVILGGMTLALCGLALWRVIDPLTRPEAALVREARGRGRARELEREKQAVLKAIKEIELDHQMRKIADVDYRELIERYRGRALRLLSEIEAGDNFRELIERELKDRLAAVGARTVPPAAVPATQADGAASGGRADTDGRADAAADTATQGAGPTTAAGAASPTSPAARAGATTRSCAACGTNNDDDAQFCKKCGVKIAA
jgi:hypothetical protein